MRVLLIDDDPIIEDAFRTGLANSAVELSVARSMDEARAALSGEFDLVVCDLKLPTKVGGEPQIEHGLATCDHSRTVAPGVPVLILSGFGTLDDLESRLAEAPRERYLGSDDRPLVRHTPKDRLDEAIDRVLTHANELEHLREIEIAWGADPHPLSALDRQVLRIYARQREGVVVRLRQFSGGRSGATTLWIEVENENRGIVVRGVAKLDALDDVIEEETNVRTHVAPLLPAGSYAGSIDVIRAGAAHRGGLIYALAAGHDRTLFDALRSSAAQAAEVVDRLFVATEPWHAHPVPQRARVKELRRLLLSDDRLDEVRATHGDFVDFSIEDLPVNYNESRTHGDLHGGNLLLAPDGGALLIDFGRVGFAPTCLDPITLELGAILHPDAELDLGGWPNEAQCFAWASQPFVNTSPIRAYIEACRRWLHAVVRGDRERDAMVYAYALRQLRYRDVDAGLARALCQGAVDRLLRT